MTHSSPFVFMEMTFRLLTVKKSKNKKEMKTHAPKSVSLIIYLLHPCTTKLSRYLYYKT